LVSFGRSSGCCSRNCFLLVRAADKDKPKQAASQEKNLVYELLGLHNLSVHALFTHVVNAR
jgi:hypothetical protein